jgi:hypothetical protein
MMARCLSVDSGDDDSASLLRSPTYVLIHIPNHWRGLLSFTSFTVGGITWTYFRALNMPSFSHTIHM